MNGVILRLKIKKMMFLRNLPKLLKMMKMIGVILKHLFKNKQKNRLSRKIKILENMKKMKMIGVLRNHLKKEMERWDIMIVRQARKLFIKNQLRP